MNRIRTMAFGGAAFLLLAGAANATIPARTADASPIIAGKPSADAIGPVTVTPLLVAQSDAAPAMAPMALNSMSNPPDKIATARVVDDKGATIGAVQKVDIAGGKPSDVQIALLGTRQIVVLDAGKLSYDVSNNVLTTALDKTDIVKLPAGPQG